MFIEASLIIDPVLWCHIWYSGVLVRGSWQGVFKAIGLILPGRALWIVRTRIDDKGLIVIGFQIFGSAIEPGTIFRQVFSNDETSTGQDSWLENKETSTHQ